MLATINAININNGTAVFSFSDGSVGSMSVLSPTPAPTPLPPTPGTGIITGSYFDGIPDDQVRGIADHFGMMYVRVWMSLRDWAKTPDTNDLIFQRCRRLRAAGLRVLLVVTPLEKTSTSEAFPPAPADTVTAYKWFSAAAVAANGCVDAWEVYNEPNLQQYNFDFGGNAGGGLAKLTKNVFKPAYQALHDQGEYVIGASWSEAGFSLMKYSIDNGYLDACDAAGYHPYGKDAPEQLARVVQVRSMIGATKPLWLTEWNLHMNADKTAWADQLIDAAKLIAPYVQAVIHFRMVRTTQAAGYAAPYWLDGSTLTQTASFSDKLVTALKAFA